jgi:UDP-N-acetylmuramoylalanine--D-glutamate ligase
MNINELKNKKILILGFGKEGKDTFSFLRKLFPNKSLALADKLEWEKFPQREREKIKRDKKLKIYFGKDYLKKIKEYDLIIKTPGIPKRKILPFLRKNQKITSQAEIFFKNCPGKIIGITGTKGKGTTASLIYQILKKGKLKAHLVGNIGRPVLNFLLKAKKDDIFVYELSSHQLFNLKKSPQIGVITNIFPDHLDYFKDFKEYLKAKENITKFQKKNDYLIFNASNKFSREIAKKSKARKIPFTLANFRFEQIINELNLKEKDLPLILKINPENLMAAILVAKLFKIQKEKIAEAIKNFKNQTHRLEFLGKFKGIEFYNDSAATLPEATISAIEALKNKLQTLILGGSEKNLDYSNLAKEILKSKIKNLIFFLPTGEKIWQEILKNLSKLKLEKSERYKKDKDLDYSKLTKLKFFFANSMKEAVKIAYQNTNKGKICLLSPASASFGLFKNYQERGNFFKKYVRKLANY